MLNKIPTLKFALFPLERIISDEPKIFELLDSYETDGNLIQLKNQVVGLVRVKVEQKCKDHSFFF